MILPERVEFWVPGDPITQGSKKAILDPRTGHPRAIEDRKRELLPWRKLVAQCALAARSGLAGYPLEGAVELDLFFRLPRRQKHRRRDLKRDAAVRPDADKLTRAIKDALSGVLYRDDGQVTTLRVRKRIALYADPQTGVRISIGPDLEDEPTLSTSRERAAQAALF